MPEATTDRGVTPAEVRSLGRAFRRPVGRYTYERASHLAGVPQRTLHHWAREGIFVPDFDHARPKQWSYRDLVLVRLFVWLRHAGQRPDSASRRVTVVRQLLEQAPTEALPQLHGDRRVLLVGDEEFDRLSGHRVLSGLGVYLDVFDFTESVPELPNRLWGPNLVRPSRWTSIQPLVMAGEPCILTTRVTTANFPKPRFDADQLDARVEYIHLYDFVLKRVDQQGPCLVTLPVPRITSDRVERTAGVGGRVAASRGTSLPELRSEVFPDMREELVDRGLDHLSRWVG